MTKRERLLAVLHGEMPDCVPCCPDISNMVPARMTGKPFWDIYVYKDPPLWKAHIAALKHFDIDGGFEMYGWGVDFEEEERGGRYETIWEERIVQRRADGSFVTMQFNQETGECSKYVRVHTADNPPASRVLPEKLGLPEKPTEWEKIEGVKEWPRGLEFWNLARKELGDHGVIGLSCGAGTLMLGSPEDVYSYYEDPDPWRQKTKDLIRKVERRMEHIAKMDPKPDFLLCGGSGSLVWQTPAIVRELVLPVLKRVTELAYDIGIPTHVHSCGPETELVKMAAEETKLTIIDPLEVPPMGDCDLAELKRLYGDKIALKGNLHTTEVMLKGSVDDVVAASRQAIDDGAEGGGFILSTGDQCGRDTPDENLFAMVETARTYGAYR